MQRARTVGTGFPVPPVTIACNPVIKDARRPMDPRNKQNPRQEVPARQPETDLSPGVHPRVNVAQIIDGLHRTHGLFPINMGKPANRAGIVKVEKLDTSIAVERANAFNAVTAERTRSIKEHGELRRIWHDSQTARFSVARTGQQARLCISVKVTIYEFSTPEDRQVLVDAFKKGQNLGSGQCSDQDEICRPDRDHWDARLRHRLHWVDSDPHGPEDSLYLQPSDSLR